MKVCVYCVYTSLVYFPFTFTFAYSWSSIPDMPHALEDKGPVGEMTGEKYMIRSRYDRLPLIH